MAPQPKSWDSSAFEGAGTVSFPFNSLFWGKVFPPCPWKQMPHPPGKLPFAWRLRWIAGTPLWVMSLHKWPLHQEKHKVHSLLGTSN